MERRLDKLESDMTEVKVTLARIEGRIEDMPTKDWMTTRLFWVVGAFLGLSALVQLAISFSTGISG